MAFGQYFASPHAAEWAALLDHAGRRRHEPHRAQNQAWNPEEEERDRDDRNQSLRIRLQHARRSVEIGARHSQRKDEKQAESDGDQADRKANDREKAAQADLEGGGKTDRPAAQVLKRAGKHDGLAE